MIDIGAICIRIQRLAAHHEVDALAVVALLAVHALCEVNFPQLRAWRRVAERIGGDSAV